MRHESPVTAWKEERRFLAFELREAGWEQRDIAETLGVTKGAVSQWMKTVDTQGPAALAASPRPGSPPRLGEEQWQHLLAILAKGAEAYGFRGAIWTCARVACVIMQEFGVSYHKAHVSRLLKQLEWTPQKPRQRAAQRDEAEIESWRSQKWPRLKRGR
jgi:transposase